LDEAQHSIALHTTLQLRAQPVAGAAAAMGLWRWWQRCRHSGVTCSGSTRGGRCGWQWLLIMPAPILCAQLLFST